MSSDEHLRTALDDIAAILRAPLEARLAGYAEELRREMAEDAERAAQEAAGRAAEQLAELRRTADEQLDAARRASEAEIAEARLAAEADVAAVRHKADTEIRAVREQANAEAAALRTQADSEIEDARRTAQTQVEDVQRAFDERLAQSGRALEDARRQLERTRAELEAARQRFEDNQRRLDVARIETDEARARGADDLQRLAQAIRALDEASGLGEVLARLARINRRDGERAAVLIVKGERLRGWRTVGFGEERERSGRIEVPFDDPGLAGEAVRTRRAAVSADAQRLPAFARTDEQRQAVALPVTVSGEVVALLYVDALQADTSDDGGRAAALEVLARHASRVLEALTIQKAVGLLPTSDAAPAAVAARHTGRGAK